MGKPTAPTPPDPKVVAGAQAGTNVATAIANRQLAQVDQFGPGGSLTYSQTGTFDFTDPNSGKTYQIPQYAETTALSPGQQAIYDQNQAMKLSLAAGATEGATFLQGYLPDRSGMEVPDYQTPARGGDVTQSYGVQAPARGGDITQSYRAQPLGGSGDVTQSYGAQVAGRGGDSTQALGGGGNIRAGYGAQALGGGGDVTQSYDAQLAGRGGDITQALDASGNIRAGYGGQARGDAREGTQAYGAQVAARGGEGAQS